MPEYPAIYEEGEDGSDLLYEPDPRNTPPTHACSRCGHPTSILYRDCAVHDPLGDTAFNRCARCKQDYSAHGPYGQCHDWAPEHANDSLPPYFTR